MELSARELFVCAIVISLRPRAFSPNASKFERKPEIDSNSVISGTLWDANGQSDDLECVYPVYYWCHGVLVSLLVFLVVAVTMLFFYSFARLMKSILRMDIIGELRLC